MLTLTLTLWSVVQRIHLGVNEFASAAASDTPSAEGSNAITRLPLRPSLQVNMGLDPDRKPDARSQLEGLRLRVLRIGG